ncbi:MAG: glycosyltransferase [Candidatus Sulfotelmatobacter sp.]|jgi:glycosyl transferase-like sugar-binding protein
MSPNDALTRPPIQGLWVGDSLSIMERVCILSYLRHGHPFRLYTYGPVRNVPSGAEICDGNEILPRSAVFQYSNGSFAGFANFFRYKLLLEKGGFWVDLDTICLKPFDFPQVYVFSAEMHHGTPVVNCAVIKAPKGSEFCKYAWEVCHGKNIKKLIWGETGPRLVGEGVELLGLQKYVVGPEVFCPIDPDTWEEIFNPKGRTEFHPQTRAVHLWNELWRREGLDKNAGYDPGCIYERLKVAYSGL